MRVTSQNLEELKDSRGTANFALKWAKDARKAAYLNVVPVKGLTRHMTEADDLVWVPFVGFDCRGLDVVGFHPEAGLFQASQLHPFYWHSVYYVTCALIEELPFIKFWCL